MRISRWKYTIDFINSIENGEVFDTKEMLNYVRERINKTSPITLYGYRTTLSRLGYLKDIKFKLWLKVKDFPYDVGAREARIVAWATGWESWFIQPGWEISSTYASKK